MKIRVYHRLVGGRVPHDEEPQLKAVAEGLRRHGHDPVWTRDPAPCDLAVAFGVRYFRPEIALARRALIVEMGFVGERTRWTALGFDGWGGYGDFMNEGSPPDRWNRHFAPLMRPWRGFGIKDEDDEYVLILGQVPGDDDLPGVDLPLLYARWAAGLKALGFAVAFRPHPLTPRRSDIGLRMKALGCRVLGGTLAEDLALADWTVTHSSNAAVDSVLAGVPAVAVDRGSMAWPVAGRDPFRAPPAPDRARWAADLAYAQWSLDEIARGDAWDHLKVRL